MFGGTDQGGLTEALVFLAIVIVALASTVNFTMKPVKQEKNTAQDQ